MKNLTNEIINNLPLLSNTNTNTNTIINGVPLTFKADTGTYIISTHYTHNTNIQPPTDLIHNGKFYLTFFEVINYLTSITEARNNGASF